MSNPSDAPPMHEWPDGQVREEAPYRCGCFVAATGEQCTKLSDHEGPHVFASDPSDAPRTEPMSDRKPVRPRVGLKRLENIVLAAYVEGYIQGAAHPKGKRVMESARTLSKLFWAIVERNITAPEIQQ